MCSIESLMLARYGYILNTCDTAAVGVGMGDMYNDIIMFNRIFSE